MPKRKTDIETITQQAEEKALKKPEPKKAEYNYDGDFGQVISTGSTLLDLAISGSRIRGGGLPGGIMVEIFGPEGSGKSVLLAQIAGNIQKAKGDIWFNDTEGRLDRAFAFLSGAKIDDGNSVIMPSINDTFQFIRSEWEPTGTGINGAFIDSLANLVSDEEVDAGYAGARRAAVFNEALRKTSTVIKDKKYLVVCSNQVRDNLSAMAFGKKTRAAGNSRATLHQMSLRLEINKPRKLVKEIKVHGKKIKQTYGVKANIKVEKSSIDSPFREAPIYIIFAYGIDDIQANLQFYKDMTGDSTYVNPELADSGFKAMDDAISNIEEKGLENDLKEKVIEFWHEIQEKFLTKRKRRV